MSDFLNLEDIAYSNLKKLNSLLENLSSNLSKDKTENALKEGYNYIKEIEYIIDRIEKLKKERCGNNNLFMIKDDFSKKKEKFEKIQKNYIINKINKIIDSSSDKNSTKIENNEEYTNIDKDYSINYNYIFEDNSDDNEYGKNFIDEYFKENENNSNLSRKYLYNDNFLFIIKGIANRFFSKVNNGIKKIPPKIKYLIILIILIISLIFCIFGLYNTLINFK